MKNTRIFIVMLVMITALTACLPVFAAEDVASPSATSESVISPCWTNTERVDLGLNFSGTRANCSSMVIGKAGTTRITATVTLQRQNSNGTYTTIKTWSGLSATGSMLVFSDSYGVTHGHNYRLNINARVYRGSAGESVSQYIERYFS